MDEEKSEPRVEDLAHRGAAWWWHQVIVQALDGMTAVKTWSKLEKEIKKQWPTH